MTVQTITLKVPEALYERVKQKATRANRPIEDVVLEMVAVAMPENESASPDSPPNQVPPELQQELATMSTFNDKALWKAARNHEIAKVAKRLSQLTHKRQTQTLTHLKLRN